MVKAGIAAAAGALVVGLAYSVFRITMADPVPGAASAMDVSSLGERVLVVAPHPDDEIVNPSGLIALAQARGARVRVVLLTTGDGYRRAAQGLVRGQVRPATFLELGRKRHAESERALDEAGVPAPDRAYLGYPDGSLNSLWERNWDRETPHLGSTGCTAVPYSFALHPGEVFCGENLVADLTGMIEDFRPTAIVYPEAADQHHDHWAAAAFVEYSIQATRYTGVRLKYLTHYRWYPFPWAYVPSAFLSPPIPLRASDVGLRWQSLRLPAGDVNAKNREVRVFRTQMRIPHMRAYLLSFVRRNEIFCTYAPTGVAKSDSDALPAGAGVSAAGIVPEPSGRIVSVDGPRGDIRSVRLVRGPSRAWMGIRTWDGSPRDLEYCFELRVFGNPARRLDVTVRGDRITPLRLSESSVVPDGLRTARSDGTVWIGFDAALLRGSGTCMVGARTNVPGSRLRPERSAWRPMKL